MQSFIAALKALRHPKSTHRKSNPPKPPPPQNPTPNPPKTHPPQPPTRLRKTVVLKVPVPGLVQPLLTPEVSERADVCQAEGEAKQILIAHVRNGIAAVFDGHTAAIPVVGGLRGGKLQLPRFRVEAKAGGRAQSPARQPSIAQGHTELLELAGGLRRAVRTRARPFGRSRSCRGLGNLQERVAAAYRESAEIIVQEQRAGVNAAQLKVVVEVPLRIGVAAGGRPQARHQGRKMPGFGGECDARQFLRRSEDVALSGHQRSTEG